MNSVTLIGAVKVPYTGGGKTLYRREYRALREDFDELPKDDDLASGSICRFPDTGEYAEYFAANQTWYIRSGAGAGGSGSGSGSGSGGGSSDPEEDEETATDEEIGNMLDEIFGS